MSWFNRLFMRRRIYSELSEEIQQHLAEKIEALMAEGMSRDQAEYAAKRAFGNVTRIEESAREAWMWPKTESILADFKFALRKLLHSPGFAVTAILTLAIGIGTNVVTFSMLNGILLRPLDVPRPESLLQIEENESYPDYRDYQDRNQSFTGMLAYKIMTAGIGIDHSVSTSWGEAASGNYFDVLGLQPSLGHFFHASDEHGPASAPYIVLSYEFWQRSFAASPQVVGQVVTLNQHPFTIVGIAPQNFHGTDYFFWPDYWIPQVNAEQVDGWEDFWRNHRSFTVLGRLKPGVREQQAAQNIEAISRQMAKEYREDEGLTRTVRKPGAAGNSDDPRIKALFGMAILALLILLAACTNLASIFAARAADRSVELAIRLAIGSSRWTIVRQLLAETVLISLIGGLVGTLFACLQLATLAHFSVNDFPMHFLIAPDLRVYLVAIALSAASGLAFGILPARQIWNTDAIQAIKNNAVSAGSFRRFAVRDFLLLIQVAACTLLVTSALVMVHGMVQRLRAPLGIVPRGVTLARIDLKVAGIPDAQSRIVEKACWTQRLLSLE